MKALPKPFTERMKVLLGDRFESYLKAISEPPVRALRVNTAKISLTDFEKSADFPIEKIPYVENGYFFECEKIGNHPLHHAGAIYVQEPAAMMPAECLNIQHDWKILDMCAAPGGKSTQLQNKLSEKGLLVSNEIISSRCKILASNIERLGLCNTVTTSLPPDTVARYFSRYFDMIMVDAPCSGEGMFRKEDIAIDEWSEDNVQKCAQRQMQILEAACKALKSGGYIVYSTCTFSLEENETVLDNFLRSHPQFEILPVNEAIRQNSEDAVMYCPTLDPQIKNARRFYPHTGKGEGQFMALLHDTSYAEEASETATGAKNKSKRNDKNTKTQKAPNASDMEQVFKFLDSTLTSYDKNAVKIKNGIPIWFPCDADMTDIPTFTCGATVGEIKKGYILPHHSFFMAMGASFKNRIELDQNSTELKKFLYGEEFDTGAPDGWAAVTVCGCTVGGVKVVLGKAKNHYPKGLRTKNLL